MSQHGVFHILSVFLEMDCDFMEALCCLQVCGDADLWAVQTLQWEDAEYPGAGICRGPGCEWAQTEEAEHGERTTQDPVFRPGVNICPELITSGRCWGLNATECDFGAGVGFCPLTSYIQMFNPTSFSDFFVCGHSHIIKTDHHIMIATF